MTDDELDEAICDLVGVIADLAAVAGTATELRTRVSARIVSGRHGAVPTMMRAALGRVIADCSFRDEPPAGSA